jgi:hypothetical protein
VLLLKQQQRERMELEQQKRKGIKLKGMQLQKGWSKLSIKRSSNNRQAESRSSRCARVSRLKQ